MTSQMCAYDYTWAGRKIQINLGTYYPERNLGIVEAEILYSFVFDGDTYYSLTKVCEGFNSVLADECVFVS